MNETVIKQTEEITVDPYTGLISINKTDPQLNAMLKVHGIHLKLANTLAYVFTNTPERKLIMENMRDVPYRVSPVILQYFKGTKLPALFEKLGIFTIILYGSRNTKTLGGGSYNYLVKMKNGDNVFINIPKKRKDGSHISETKASVLALLELLHKLLTIKNIVKESEIHERLEDRIEAYKKARGDISSVALALHPEKTMAGEDDAECDPITGSQLSIVDEEDNLGDVLLKHLETKCNI